MPPGTGDAQLSLSQMVKCAGAVVVTTPQEVALADVRKAVNMLGKVNIDVLGIVENMSGFVTPDGTRHDIFGTGGGALLAEKLNVPLLASLPIEPSIREGGDTGVPVASDQSKPSFRLFQELALKIIYILDSKVSEAPALNVIN
jgi:ATP-binding protein involved in chromosome partitioning